MDRWPSHLWRKILERADRDPEMHPIHDEHETHDGQAPR